MFTKVKDYFKNVWAKYMALHWAVRFKMIFTFIPNLLLYLLGEGLLTAAKGTAWVNEKIYNFTLHEPDFSGLKEVWGGIKELGRQLKEKPRIVKIKVTVCFIPALVLFVITNIGEFADKYGTKMISWAWRDPRYGKNLAGQKRVVLSKSAISAEPVREAQW
ncbi:MAG: hypothetical protein J5965_22235 [Aeriscardovia sp.]|nr:hypothetical protein [Aeriscardovia sp.]